MTRSTSEQAPSETGCCPRFDPALWDEKDQTWQGRLFVKDHVLACLHIPLNFAAVMTRNMARIDASGAHSDGVVLSDEVSLWRSDVYIGVDQEVPGADMQRLSGTFLSRVFEGPFSHVGRWVREMHSYAKSRGVAPKKLWFYYTTCPKCAKVYGKNYVVLLAEA